MDPKKSDYLSPKFFERVKYAVGQAARLGMNYWFYDEPGFPSGQAGGQVVSYNPPKRSGIGCSTTAMENGSRATRHGSTTSIPRRPKLSSTSLTSATPRPWASTLGKPSS